MFKSRNVILLDEVPQELISVVSQKVQRPNPFALNPDSPWQEGQTLVGGSVLYYFPRYICTLSKDKLDTNLHFCRRSNSLVLVGSVESSPGGSGCPIHEPRSAQPSRTSPGETSCGQRL